MFGPNGVPGAMPAGGSAREGRGFLLPPLPGPLAFGPEDGGRCELFEVFLSADSLASSSAIASINAAPSSKSASFSAALSRYLSPLVTHMVTHIRKTHTTSICQTGERSRTSSRCSSA